MRRFPLVIAACVALAGTGASSTSATEPPPDGATISYRLDVPRAPRVCVGATLKMDAAVTRVVRPPDQDPRLARHGILAEQDGVPIAAMVANAEVLEPATAVEITGWPTFAGPPSKANFRFKAKKAGDTTIRFKASIRGMGDLEGWPGLLVDQETDRAVSVRECWFKVSIASNWEVAGEAAIGVSAGVFEAELRRTPSGTYEAQKQVMWGTVVAAVGDCSGTLIITGGTATMKGTIDDDGNLMITVSYSGAPGSIVGNCGSYSVTATADSLIIEGSSSMVLQGTEPQALNAGGQFNPGEAEYMVIPMDDESSQ